MNEKIENEKRIVLIIIQRIKTILNYYLAPSDANIEREFSISMPRFRTIIQKYPLILMKMGIELENYELKGDLIDVPQMVTNLYILNKYKFTLSKTLSLRDFSTDTIVPPKKNVVNRIITEIIYNVNKNFSFKISSSDLESRF